MVLTHVEGAVLHKAHQAREVDLAVLTFEELLQVVVAQRAVLDVDLTDNADFDLRHAGDGDGRKLLRDEREGVLHLLGGVALARQQDPAQTLDPEIDHLVGAALDVLIRGHLIAQSAEHVAVDGGKLAVKVGTDQLLNWLDSVERSMLKATADAGFYAPGPFKELVEKPHGIISLGAKMGEGWLLTAEMIELVQGGYGNIVCALSL